MNGLRESQWQEIQFRNRPKPKLKSCPPWDLPAKWRTPETPDGWIVDFIGSQQDENHIYDIYRVLCDGREYVSFIHENGYPHHRDWTRVRMDVPEENPNYHLFRKALRMLDSYLKKHPDVPLEQSTPTPLAPLRLTRTEEPEESFPF